MRFPAPCSACEKMNDAKMCVSSIPFFKEIIIMAYSCEHCGYKSTEIKNGGGISEKATKITFKVEKEEDVNRDVFKSDSCILVIPEVELSIAPGTMGSIYTTIEGLIDKLVTNLRENNPFSQGDSADSMIREKFNDFCFKLENLKSGKKPFTLILDDPLSNCFIYNPIAPEKDPKIDIEIYERTKEQNDDLGISDMKVD